MAPKPKPLLSIMGAAEAATGLVLAVAPSILVELLLGAAPGTAAGTTVSRVAGAAIFALGVACWLAREDAARRAASGLIAAMLLYNSAVVEILVLAWTKRDLAGRTGPHGAGRLLRRGPVSGKRRKAMTI
jgi:hypothetical protein